MVSKLTVLGMQSWYVLPCDVMMLSCGFRGRAGSSLGCRQAASGVLTQRQLTERPHTSLHESQVRHEFVCRIQ